MTPDAKDQPPHAHPPGERCNARCDTGHTGETWHKPFSYTTKAGKTIKVEGHWERKPGAGAKPKAPRPTSVILVPTDDLHGARSSEAYERRAQTFLVSAGDMLLHGEKERVIERFLRTTSGTKIETRRGEGWVEFGILNERTPAEVVNGDIVAAARELAAEIIQSPNLNKSRCD